MDKTEVAERRQTIDILPIQSLISISRIKPKGKDTGVDTRLLSFEPCRGELQIPDLSIPAMCQSGKAMQVLNYRHGQGLQLEVKRPTIKMNFRIWSQLREVL